MFVIDSGRLAANSGDGVPGMRPGLLYVNVAPSPDDWSAKPPNDAPLLVVPSLLVCADALAPTPARNATPTSATRTRLCRRTRDLSRSGGSVAGDGGPLRFSCRPSATAHRLVQHPGESVRVLAQRDHRYCDTGEDEP